MYSRTYPSICSIIYFWGLLCKHEYSEFADFLAIGIIIFACVAYFQSRYPTIIKPNITIKFL